MDKPTCKQAARTQKLLHLSQPSSHSRQDDAPVVSCLPLIMSRNTIENHFLTPDHKTTQHNPVLNIMSGFERSTGKSLSGVPLASHINRKADG